MGLRHHALELFFLSSYMRDAWPVQVQSKIDVFQKISSKSYQVYTLVRA